MNVDPRAEDAQAPASNPPPLRNLSYAPLRADDAGQGSANDIEMVMDVPVQLTVEIGRVRMSIRELLTLGPGAVVELDAQAGQPLDVLINGCLVAQGDVVVANDVYAIRLTEIVTPAERMRRLNR